MTQTVNHIIELIRSSNVTLKADKKLCYSLFKAYLDLQIEFCIDASFPQIKELFSLPESNSLPAAM